MKFLLLLVVIVAVLWLAGRGRRRVGRGAAAPPPLPAQEDVVACSHCGLHLPRSEALPGRGGMFCSQDHRAAFEQAHS